MIEVSISPFQTVTIGSSAVIICNITLNTAIGPDLSVLTYYWYHNNTDITNRSEIFEQNKETNAVTTILNIRSVQTLSAGIYNCSAEIGGGDVVTSRTDLCISGEVKQNGLYYNIF